MTTPRRKAPPKQPRPAPHVRQQGAWGTRHHSKPPAAFTATGQRAPTPGIGQRSAEWLARRRTATVSNRGKAKRLGRNAHRGATSAQARWNSRTSPRRRRVRRPPPRRGMIFGVLTVAIAAVALTALTIELVSTVAASELFFAAETIAAGTAWWIGEPAPPRQRTQRPAGKGGYVRGGLCGAPTSDKSPCQNPVKAGSKGCHHHSGGAAAVGTTSGITKSKAKATAPKPKTKAATP